jgi:hypothetical protein
MNKITRDETEHGVEYVRADEAQAEVLEQCRIIAMGAEREDALAAEVERLNKALQWEQNRAGRIGTHGPGCHTWGPAHYECLLRENERLKANIALDKMAENARELGLDYEPAVQEPYKGLSEHLSQASGGMVRIDPVTGNVGIGTPAAQPAVQEGRDWSLLEATQESLREHMAEIKRLKAAQPEIKLKGKNHG